MKFTRIVILCNLCYQQTGGDIETPADHTLIFKTSEETDDFFRLDVCEDHASNGTDLIELIAAAEPVDPSTPVTHRAIGRPRKEASVVVPDTFQSRLLPCPECDKNFRGKSGLALHMKAKHPEAWNQIVIEREREAERLNTEALHREGTKTQ
jgi:hypothetical protein